MNQSGHVLILNVDSRQQIHWLVLIDRAWRADVVEAARTSWDDDHAKHPIEPNHLSRRA